MGPSGSDRARIENLEREVSELRRELRRSRGGPPNLRQFAIHLAKAYGGPIDQAGGEAKIWYWDGEALVESGNPPVAVHDPLLSDGEEIEENTALYIARFADGRWRVISAGCDAAPNPWIEGGEPEA